MNSHINISLFFLMTPIIRLAINAEAAFLFESSHYWPDTCAF